MNDLKGSIKVNFGTNKKSGNRYFDIIIKVDSEELKVDLKPGIEAVAEAMETDKEFVNYALDKTYTYLKSILNDV